MCASSGRGASRGAAFAFGSSATLIVSGGAAGAGRLGQPRQPELVAWLPQLDHLGLDEVVVDDEGHLPFVVRRRHRHQPPPCSASVITSPAKLRREPRRISSRATGHSSGSVTIPILSTPASFTAAMIFTTSP